MNRGDGPHERRLQRTGEGNLGEFAVNLFFRKDLMRYLIIEGCKEKEISYRTKNKYIDNKKIIN